MNTGGGGTSMIMIFTGKMWIPRKPTLDIPSLKMKSGNSDATVQFTNYPFPMFDLMDPDRVWFDTIDDSRNIRANARIYNHAQDWMK